MKSLFVNILYFVTFIFVTSVPIENTFVNLSKHVNKTCPQLYPILNGSSEDLNVCQIFPSAVLTEYNKYVYLCVAVLDAEYQLCNVIGKQKNENLPKNVSELQAAIAEISSKAPDIVCKELIAFTGTGLTLTHSYLLQLDKFLKSKNMCANICIGLETTTNKLCSMLNYLYKHIDNSNNIQSVEKKRIHNSVENISKSQNNTFLIKTEHESDNKVLNSESKNTLDASDKPAATDGRLPMDRIQTNQTSNVKKPINVSMQNGNIKLGNSADVNDLNIDESVPNQHKPYEEVVNPLNSVMPTIEIVSQGSDDTKVVDIKKTGAITDINTFKSFKHVNVLGDVLPLGDKAVTKKTTTIPVSNTKVQLPIQASAKSNIEINPEVDNKKKIEDKKITDPDDDLESATNPENEDEYAGDNDDIETVKEAAINTLKRKDEMSVINPAKQNDLGYDEVEDSNFFSYFMFISVIFICGYIAYHNKQKILALVLEGRRERGSRRRPNTASYRKLNSNLEEAVTSKSSGSAAHVIY